MTTRDLVRCGEPDGIAAARTELARLYQDLSRVDGIGGTLGGLA